MKNEFTLAFNEVLEDKHLPKEVILEAVQAAMVSAYQKAVNATKGQHIEAKIDPETGNVTIYAEKEIVQSVQDERTEVSLEDARKIDPDAPIGGLLIVETIPKDFGRVAAQTARQVIQQRIREAERNSQYDYFAKQLNEIVSGVVQAINNGNVTLGMDLSAEGILPRKEQIPGERFHIHDRARALLLEVKSTSRGPQIILSRAHKNFLRRLLENEVPEIYHGTVDIRSIAREPGQRSKVAVAALKPGIDPVGACVGIRGVRIQAIVRELHDEKIDVIEWSADPTVYIAKALSPARVVGVYLDELIKGAKTATVVVPEDQLSLAIGRDGQNARLAAKLTSWRIDIKSQIEAANDLLNKLETNPEYALFVQQEQEVIPQVKNILTKKAESRPVTPEEYQLISKFINRVESSVIAQQKALYKEEEEQIRSARAKVPESAFNFVLEDAGLSDRVSKALREANYTTLGELMLHVEMDPDVVLKVNGIGPKAMEEIEKRLAEYRTTVEAEELRKEYEEAISVEIVQPEPEVTEAYELPIAAEEVKSVETETLLEEPISLPPTEEPLVEALTGPKEVTLEREIPQSMDELFKFKPEAFEASEEVEEELEQDQLLDDRKKQKKKFVEMEYDPDKGIMIVKKTRKRTKDWEASSWDELES